MLVVFHDIQRFRFFTCYLPHRANIGPGRCRSQRVKPQCLPLSESVQKMKVFPMLDNLETYSRNIFFAVPTPPALLIGAKPLSLKYGAVTKLSFGRELVSIVELRMSNQRFLSVQRIQFFTLQNF